VTSSYHEVSVRKQGGEQAAITLADGEVSANKDFELVWTPKAGAQPTAALFKERVGDEDHILLMLTPPKGERAPAPKPREVIFVIDNSGSMSGPSMEQAKQSLILALGTLKPGDLFNVVRFDDTLDVYFRQPQPPTPDNIEKVRTWVGSLEANGGTEMLPAMRAALTDYTPADESRLRQVIFLTDGAIGNEAQLFEAVAEGLGRSRLFPVGIGSAPNSFFMSRAARLGRGTYTHIGDVNQVSERMAELFEKIERPIMTEVLADWPEAARAEAWPNPLPDLYAGEPVVLTAKMPEATGEVTLTGLLDGRRWAATIDLDKAVAGDGVSKLWARRKIASAEESRFDGAPYDEVDRKVLSVALQHHLVSRLTSLVAVDVTPSRPTDAPLASAEVPLALPEGWDFDKVFGDLGPQIERRLIEIQDASVEDAERFGLVKLAAAPGLDPARAPGAPLPLGSTPAPLLMLVGLLLIALAGLLLGAGRARAWR
ncbi:MAG: VWA domain-containing protein, partial [Pseudomonadota bacterium]